MAVEGRDEEVVLITFLKPWASYYVGERAYFLPEHAQALIDDGVADAPGPAAEPEQQETGD